MPALEAALLSANAACAARRAAAMWTLTAGLVLGPIICASSRASRARCGPPAPGSIRKSSPSAASDAGSSRLPAVLGCGATSGASASTPGDVELTGGAVAGFLAAGRTSSSTSSPASSLSMPARRSVRVSRTLCRSARRDCVRRSALACSTFSSARCVSSAAWTAAEVSSAEEPSAFSASRNFSSSSRTTGPGSLAVVFAASASMRS